LPVTIAFVLMIGTGRAHSLTHSAVARLPPTSALIRSRCVCLRRFRLLGSEEHRATRRQSIPLADPIRCPSQLPAAHLRPCRGWQGRARGARVPCVCRGQSPSGGGESVPRGASWPKPV
jgi:hypothetical protein